MIEKRDAARDPERERLRLLRILTERGPGDRPCGAYLRAWVDAPDDPDLMTHINECALCGPIVHGDGIDFFGSLDEEVARRIAQRRRRQRRRFLGAGAAAVLLVSVGVGITMMPTRTSPQPPTLPAFVKLYDTLDETLATYGRVAIDAKFASATPAVRSDMVGWIVERNQTSIFDIVVTATSDPDINVRRVAVVSLLDNPVAFKPFLPQLQAAQASESDPELRQSFAEVVREIMSS